MTTETKQCVQAAIAELERGCRLYCQWYDTGQPDMTGGMVAYEMVSFMRQALHTLKGEDDSE